MRVVETLCRDFVWTFRELQRVTKGSSREALSVISQKKQGNTWGPRCEFLRTLKKDSHRFRNWTQPSADELLAADAFVLSADAGLGVERDGTRFAKSLFGVRECVVGESRGSLEGYVSRVF